MKQLPHWDRLRTTGAAEVLSLLSFELTPRKIDTWHGTRPATVFHPSWYGMIICCNVRCSACIKIHSQGYHSDLCERRSRGSSHQASASRLGRGGVAGEGGVAVVGAALATRRELDGCRFAQPEPTVGCVVWQRRSAAQKWTVC